MSWKKLVTSGSNASLGSLTCTDLTVAPVGFGSLSFTSSISQSSEGTQNFLPSWYFHSGYNFDAVIAHSSQLAANGYPDTAIRLGGSNGNINLSAGGGPSENSGALIKLRKNEEIIYRVNAGKIHQFKVGNSEIAKITSAGVSASAITSSHISASQATIATLNVNGSATMTGSLSFNGVNFTETSVQTHTGSNTFGSLASDTHEFTGSVHVSNGIYGAIQGTIANASDANVSNWNTAYGWGDHASAGYLTSFDITTQTDDKYLRSDQSDTFTGTINGPRLRLTATNDASVSSTEHALQIGPTNSSNIIFDANEIMARNNGAVATLNLNPDGGAVTINNNTGEASFTIGGHTVWHAGNLDSSSFLTGETSHADVVVDGDFASNGLMKRTGAGAYSIVTDNSSDWNTAHGWGNHANAGYLTSETSHTDVVQDGDFASNGLMKRTGAGSYAIVTDNSSNWDTAYGWGDHGSAGYATQTYVDTQIASGGSYNQNSSSYYSNITHDNTIRLNRIKTSTISYLPASYSPFGSPNLSSTSTFGTATNQFRGVVTSGAANVTDLKDSAGNVAQKWIQAAGATSNPNVTGEGDSGVTGPDEGPSSGTGPQIAQDTVASYYIYTEASFAQGSINVFRTKQISIPNSDDKWEFWCYFHAHGADIGTLKVYSSPNTDGCDNGTELDYVYYTNSTSFSQGPITGEVQTSEGADWLLMKIDITTLKGAGNRYIYFEHAKGTSYQADLALAEFSIKKFSIKYGTHITFDNDLDYDSSGINKTIFNEPVEISSGKTFEQIGTQGSFKLKSNGNEIQLTRPNFNYITAGNYEYNDPNNTEGKLVFRTVDSSGTAHEGLKIDYDGTLEAPSLDSAAGSNSLKYNTSTNEITYESSTRKVKKNIAPATASLYNDVLNLSPSTFEWKNPKSTGTTLGLIAEEVASANSLFASYGPNFKYDNETGRIQRNESGSRVIVDDTIVPVNVDWEAITTALIGKVKSLEQRLSELENQ